MPPSLCNGFTLWPRWDFCSALYSLKNNLVEERLSELRSSLARCSGAWFFQCFTHEIFLCGQIILPIWRVWGILALAGAGLTLAWQAAERTLPWPSVVPLLGMGLIVTLLAFISRSQTEIYKDVWTLWSATVQANPKATVAQANLGKLLLQRGELQNALAHIEEAYDRIRSWIRTCSTGCTARSQLQQFPDVRDKLEELHKRLNPHAEFHRLMAMMFLVSKRRVEPSNLLRGS